MRRQSIFSKAMVFDQAHHRLVATIAAVSVILAVYSFLNGRFESAYDLGIGLDRAIPLLPWTLPIYFSLYLIAPVGAVLVDGKTFARALLTMVPVALFSFAGFILFPAAYPRPSLAEVDAVWRPAFEWCYTNDPPLNTFPSLHVATAAVMGWMLRGVGQWWFWAAWSAAIALSTLTVKQHFFVDVVGGLVVAAASIAAVELLASERPS